MARGLPKGAKGLARDIPYFGAQLCEAAENIAVGDIVYISGVSGVLSQVSLARALTAATCSGRLLVAKHAIPSGERGICLPWQLVGADTSSQAVGDPIYLSGLTFGGTVFAIDVAGALGGFQRVVGSVVTVATAGKILLEPNLGGDPNSLGVGVSGSGGQLRVYSLTVAAGTTPSITITPGMRILDVTGVVTTAAGSAENMVVTNDGNTVVSEATSGTPAVDEVVRASDIDLTFATVTAGDALTATWDGLAVAGVITVIGHTVL